jgi:hypothetical protein
MALSAELGAVMLGGWLGFLQTGCGNANDGLIVLCATDTDYVILINIE